MPLVSVVAVLAIVGAGAGLWFGGFFAPLFAAASGTDPLCDDELKISVVADPSIAPALIDIAEDFDAAPEHCSTTSVRMQDSADTAATIATGGELDADVWIPDSLVWTDRMQAIAASLGRPAPKIAVGETVATTPVVLAAPSTRATELGEDPVGWASILAGKIGAILPDPEASAASLAGLAALRANSSQEDPRQFAGAAIELGKTIPASTEAAFGTVLSADQPVVAITTERAVAAYNTSEAGTALVAVYPVDGTVALQYPFIRLGEAAAAANEAEGDGEAADAAGDAEGSTTEDGGTEEGATEDGDAEAGADDAEGGDDAEAAALTSRDELVVALEAAVRGSGERLAAAGFRAGDGSGEIVAAGVVEEPAEAQPVVDGAGQLELLRSWGMLNLRSRMLAVIDVSGSMEEPAENGLRRIDIFQQAAIGAMSKFSGEVELGVWVFSTLRNGDLDYEDLVPIGPLADQAHTQQIHGVIQSLPERLGGGTALYDSTLAAVQRVRESYDPSKVNSVLLITDGKNEDDAGGIDLDTLLAELEKMNDPKQPVPVIMIGFGPDTDMEAMTRIAKVTGGGAYSATKPEDLGIVLVDALSQRSCRPDCAVPGE